MKYTILTRSQSTDYEALEHDSNFKRNRIVPNHLHGWPKIPFKMIYSYSVIRTRTHGIYMVSIEMVHWNGLLIISSTPLLMPHVMTLQKAKREKNNNNITYECISWIFLVSKYDQSILFLFIGSPRFIPFKTTRFYCYYFVCVPLSTDYSAMIYKQTHLFIKKKKQQYNSRTCAFLLVLSLFSEVQLCCRESVKSLSERTYTIYVGTESKSHNITSLRFPNKSFYFLRSFIVSLPAFQHWEMILISVVVVCFALFVESMAQSVFRMFKNSWHSLMCGPQIYLHDQHHLVAIPMMDGFFFWAAKFMTWHYGNYSMWFEEIMATLIHHYDVGLGKMSFCDAFGSPNSRSPYQSVFGTNKRSSNVVITCPHHIDSRIKCGSVMITIQFFASHQSECINRSFSSVSSLWFVVH